MAHWGFGTLLKIGDGAGSETFTTIAEVTDIGGPSFAKDAIETTNHSSTDGWREFIPGLKDAGEITFTVNFLPTDATHDDTTGLIEQLYDDDSHNFQLVLSDTGTETISFTAFITAFDISAPIDDVLGADITMKITGKPTWA